VIFIAFEVVENYGIELELDQLGGSNKV